MNDSLEAIIRVDNLSVEFPSSAGIVHAVSGVNLDLRRGEVLALVGESGSGKTITAQTILGLAPERPGRITSGTILFNDNDLLSLDEAGWRRIRGRSIAMVFQDPMTSLNPFIRVGKQLAEVIVQHNRSLSRRAVRDRCVELLEVVGIPDARRRSKQFPHEFSGGMRQRVLIALAIANDPEVLLADEPTTALDVTVQAQIVEVLRTLRERTKSTLFLITHDLGLVAELADRVVVMYAGSVVESGTVDEIFHRPRHPYTVGLLRSRPRLTGSVEALKPIPGAPPNLASLPQGCAFQPRCFLSNGRKECTDTRPVLKVESAGHEAACHFSSELRLISTSAAGRES